MRQALIHFPAKLHVPKQNQMADCLTSALPDLRNHIWVCLASKASRMKLAALAEVRVVKLQAFCVSPEGVCQSAPPKAAQEEGLWQDPGVRGFLSHPETLVTWSLLVHSRFASLPWARRLAVDGCWVLKLVKSTAQAIFVHLAQRFFGSLPAVQIITSCLQWQPLASIRRLMPSLRITDICPVSRDAPSVTCCRLPAGLYPTNLMPPAGHSGRWDTPMAGSRDSSRANSPNSCLSAHSHHSAPPEEPGGSAAQAPQQPAIGWGQAPVQQDGDYQEPCFGRRPHPASRGARGPSQGPRGPSSAFGRNPPHWQDRHGCSGSGRPQGQVRCQRCTTLGGTATCGRPAQNLGEPMFSDMQNWVPHGVGNSRPTFPE